RPWWRERIPPARDRWHLPPASPGGRRASPRLLFVERVRARPAGRPPSRPLFPRARPLLRLEALPDQADGGAALARHLDLCPPARHRCHGRLRLVGGHQSGAAGTAPRLSAPNRAGAGSVAGPGGARPRYLARFAEWEAGERRDGTPRPAAAHQGLPPPRRLC